MTSGSRHLAVVIERPLDDVYAYASDPVHLPQWAPGLCTAVHPTDDGRWVAESGTVRVTLDWTPRNAFGVLDHDVTTETGERFHNPMRVLHHVDGCEVVFSLRRQPGMTDAEFDRDAAAVQADLVRLKEIVES